MKRYGLLVIPLAVSLGVLSWVIAAEAQRTPEWRLKLDRYLRMNDTTMLQVVRAREPANLTPSLMGRAFRAGAFAGLALPLPPRDVYCALVSQQEKRSVIFVSYFSDNLWRDDWIIHEGPAYPLDRNMVQATAALGCDFSFEE